MGRYIIKMWKSENDLCSKDINLNMQLDTNNINEAINKAKELMKQRKYYLLAVQNNTETENYYTCSQNSECYYNKLISRAIIQEKVNKYSNIFYGENVFNDGDIIFGKVSDVTSLLKVNTSFCNTPESNCAEDYIEIVNKSTNKILSKLSVKYTPEDYIRLSENPTNGFFQVDLPNVILEDLQEQYLLNMERSNLKDINISNYVECWFDSNDIDNLEDYGPDTNSLVMPTVGDLYKDILNSIYVKHDSIFTDEISDGKYKITVNFDDENSIILETRASNTYIETASNIQDIVVKYLELQNQHSITEENDMEL